MEYRIYIKDYQSLSRLERLIYKKNLKEFMKHRMCDKAKLTQSNFFRLHTSGNVVYEILDDQFKSVDIIETHYNECQIEK